MAAIPFYTTPDGSGASFGNADAMTAKVVHAFPALGGRLFSMSFTNDTGVVQTALVFRRRSAVNTLIREVTIPIGAGILGAPVAELLDPTRMPALANVAALQDGVPWGASHEIWCAMKTTIATGTVVTQVIVGAG